MERIVVIPYVSAEPDLGRLGTAAPKATLWHAFGDRGRPLQLHLRSVQSSALYSLLLGHDGRPKCIVHGAGGTLLQHQKEHLLHTDVKRGDRLFYFTTCGWMMWNWLASALATGATIVLYDGSPFHPDPGVLWRLAEQSG